MNGVYNEIVTVKITHNEACQDIPKIQVVIELDFAIAGPIFSIFYDVFVRCNVVLVVVQVCVRHTCNKLNSTQHFVACSGYTVLRAYDSPVSSSVT